MDNSTSAWKRFLAEMKRRRVFRAIAFYGTGVFALLQLADLATPALGLSPSFLSVLMVVCLSGFPFAVFAAWTFDLTAYGLQRTQVATSGEIEAILALPGSQRWPAGVLGLVGVLLLVGGSWWVVTRQRQVLEVPPVTQPSLWVAVLPLENRGAASDDPFSDGLTEELGLALSRLPGVRVVAHTSVYAYQGRSIDARTIGRELSVGTIVEGSVQRSGGSVRISVVLSGTADGFRVWAQTWERELTAANLFAIQDAIALEVARALAASVAPGASAGQSPATDLAAVTLVQPPASSQKIPVTDGCVPPGGSSAPGATDSGWPCCRSASRSRSRSGREPRARPASRRRPSSVLTGRGR
jgi:TolB-like protein